MIKVYSKLKKKKLLHIISNKNYFSRMKSPRLDISSKEQFIQVATLLLSKNQTFLAHRHIWKVPRFKKTIAQESWIILEGKVRMYAYDIDGSFIKSFLLKNGNFSITYEGGHNYKALTKNTKVIEYKTGPYEGVKRDKVFI
jgi:hypothetical protein